MNPLSTARYKDSLGTVNGWAQYVAQQCAATTRRRIPRAATSTCSDRPATEPHFNTGGEVPIDPRTGKLFIPAA